MSSPKLKLLLSISLLFVLSNAVFAQDRTWRTFNAPVGGWSVLAPGVMQPDEEAKRGGGKGSYSYYDQNGFFAVIYSYLGFVFSKGGHYRKQRDMVIKANNAKLIKDIEFTNGNIKGREVSIRIADTRVISRESNIKSADRVQRFRMFFKDGRFYILLVVLPETDIDKPEVNNYLSSFTFK